MCRIIGFITPGRKRDIVIELAILFFVVRVLQIHRPDRSACLGVDNPSVCIHPGAEGLGTLFESAAERNDMNLCIGLKHEADPFYFRLFEILQLNKRALTCRGCKSESKNENRNEQQKTCRANKPASMYVRS